MMAQLVKTNRGGGYIYTKIRDGTDFQFWRCKNHKAGCPARATSEGLSVVVRNEHDHPPNPAEITTQVAIAGMRKRARDESTSINVIYDDQLDVISQDLLMCWHNCLALSLSGPLCTELDTKTLPSFRPSEEMSASLPDSQTLEVGKTSSWLTMTRS